MSKDGMNCFLSDWRTPPIMPDISGLKPQTVSCLNLVLVMNWNGLGMVRLSVHLGLHPSP